MNRKFRIMFTLCISMCIGFAFITGVSAEEKIHNSTNRQVVTYEEAVQLAEDGVYINNESMQVYHDIEHYDDGLIAETITVIEKVETVQTKSGVTTDSYQLRAGTTLYHHDWVNSCTIYITMTYNLKTIGFDTVATLTSFGHKWINDASHGVTVYLLSSLGKQDGMRGGTSGLWKNESTTLNTYNPSANNYYTKSTDFRLHVLTNYCTLGVLTKVTFQTKDGGTTYGPYSLPYYAYQTITGR